MDEADERMEPPLATVDVATLDGTTLIRIVAQPGWRWSTSMGPSAGTATCQLPHVGYVISGRMHIVNDDGSEGDITGGDAWALDAGHDAWVVGDEPVHFLEVVAAPG
jgi:hypothetical protein